MNDDIISQRMAIDAAVKESQMDGAYGYMDTKSIVDLLSDLPSAQPERRWIPCSERLPEDGERVLATHLGGLNPNKQVIEHIYVNGEFTMG